VLQKPHLSELLERLLGIPEVIPDPKRALFVHGVQSSCASTYDDSELPQGRAGHGSFH
jgi:hypothetical protein